MQEWPQGDDAGAGDTKIRFDDAVDAAWDLVPCGVERGGGRDESMQAQKRNKDGSVRERLSPKYVLRSEGRGFVKTYAPLKAIATPKNNLCWRGADEYRSITSSLKRITKSRAILSAYEVKKKAVLLIYLVPSNLGF